MKNIYKNTARVSTSVVFFLLVSVAAIAQNGVRIAGTAGTADQSAMLDIVSTNKGVLFPRMSLTSLTANSSPVTNPQAGLVIYNTGSVAVPATGLYFWNGSSWVFLNTGGFSAAGTTNYHAKFTASNAIGNSIVYDDGTNVGIGTSTPATNLQVSGSTSAALTVSSSNYPATYKTQLGAQPSAQGVLVLGNNSTNEIRFGNTLAGGYGNIYVNNTADYSSASTGTLAATFAANGSIGIGTATPGALLDLQGVSGMRIGYGSYAANLVFGNTAVWKSGIRVYDNGVAEMRIWHANASGLIVLATGYNGDQSTTLPTDGLFVRANNVGIGASSPAYRLEVKGNIFNTNPSQGSLGLTGDLPGYAINTYPTLKSTGSYLYISVGGAYSSYIAAGGGYTAVSSRAKKQNFETLDKEDILRKINGLEMMKWSYKCESPEVKHIGPFAEDFHDKFGLNGPNDSMICHIDPSGVALVGIQALSKQVNDLKAENNLLKQSLDKLKAEMIEMKNVLISKEGMK